MTRIMKYINFLLVLTLVFCYTGIASEVHHSSTLPTSIENHHAKSQKCDKQENSHLEISDNYYKNTNTTKHEGLECCHYMLPNAPHNYEFNPVDTFLYSVAVNISLENNKVFRYTSGLKIIREHDPPKLFLSNSSFLL